MRSLTLPILALALCSCSKSTSLAASDAPPQNWPQWRGPDGQGHAPVKELPAKWSETENIAWKTATPGRGWSSPVIWGGKVWITTAIEKAAKPEDAEKRLKANTGDQPVTVLESVSLRAVCLDAKTGVIEKDIELLNEREPQWVHQLNSYASPSPVIEEGRLYAHFGAFGTACLDTAGGSVLWTNRDIRIMHENGPGSTPVLHGDMLIFHCDGSDQQFVVALDKHTGKEAWRTKRSGEMRENPQMKKAYGTPLIVDMNGAPVAVSTGADWVYGYEPATGKELWKVAYGQLGFSMSVKPVAGDGLIFFSTCFAKPEIFCLKYTGLPTPEIVWHDSKNGPNMASPVLENGLLFYVSEGGIASSVEAATGRTFYRERLRGKFSASPILAAGRLYYSNREGVTFVVPAAREFSILAENKLDGQIMASPAAIEGAIFLRTDKALYRIGQ